jgi:hypothetical protein
MRANTRITSSNSYGLEVIRPSLNETVAWLSLWDKDVANEVVRLGPGLLLGFGDPASLSTTLRSAALTALLRELTAHEQEWPWWDNDKIRRFAYPELGPVVLSLWPQYRSHQEASQLLMRVIWLGELTECGHLARDVAFDNAADPTLRVFAGKALLAMPDGSTRRDYSELIKADTGTLPVRMVRDAIVELAPSLITVSDILRILREVNIEDDASFDFKRDVTTIVKRLVTVADLEMFLAGLLAQLDSELGDHAHYPPTKREEAFFPAIAEAALCLLKAVHSNNAPDAAIDAVLRILNRREHNSRVGGTANEALVDFSERRNDDGGPFGASSPRSERSLHGSRLSAYGKLGFWGTR